MVTPWMRDRWSASYSSRVFHSTHAVPRSFAAQYRYRSSLWHSYAPCRGVIRGTAERKWIVEDPVVDDGLRVVVWDSASERRWRSERRKQMLLDSLALTIDVINVQIKIKKR